MSEWMAMEKLRLLHDKVLYGPMTCGVPMGPGPDAGRTLILDEDVPAGHHLVQPPSAPPNPSPSAPPQLSELGGGSL